MRSPCSEEEGSRSLWIEDSGGGDLKIEPKRTAHQLREVGSVSDTEIDQPFFERVNLKTAWYQSFNTGRRNFLLRPYIFTPVRLSKATLTLDYSIRGAHGSLHANPL